MLDPILLVSLVTTAMSAPAPLPYSSPYFTPRETTAAEVGYAAHETTTHRVLVNYHPQLGESGAMPIHPNSIAALEPPSTQARPQTHQSSTGPTNGQKSKERNTKELAGAVKDTLSKLEEDIHHQEGEAEHDLKGKDDHVTVDAVDAVEETLRKIDVRQEERIVDQEVNDREDRVRTDAVNHDEHIQARGKGKAADIEGTLTEKEEEVTVSTEIGGGKVGETDRHVISVEAADGIDGGSGPVYVLRAHQENIASTPRPATKATTEVGNLEPTSGTSGTRSDRLDILLDQMDGILTNSIHNEETVKNVEIASDAVKASENLPPQNSIPQTNGQQPGTSHIRVAQSNAPQTRVPQTKAGKASSRVRDLMSESLRLIQQKARGKIPSVSAANHLTDNKLPSQISESAGTQVPNAVESVIESLRAPISQKPHKEQITINNQPNKELSSSGPRKANTARTVFVDDVMGSASSGAGRNLLDSLGLRSGQTLPATFSLDFNGKHREEDMKKENLKLIRHVIANIDDLFEIVYEGQDSRSKGIDKGLHITGQLQLEDI